MDLLSEELLFFGDDSGALGLYLAVRAAVMERWPATTVIVHKTQINLQDPRPYCWISFTLGKGGRKRTAPKITVSFVHPHPTNSERIPHRSEPYPGRFMHHLALRSADEVDAELMGWIALSRAFRNKLL